MTKLIKVLVVDDSAYNRKAISSMLESSNLIEVIDTAMDGEDAIKKLIKLQPDMVTLDLEMPRMDGFTFLRWVMSNRPLPILIVSSKGSKDNVFQAMELGAVDFLVKPTSEISEEIKNLKDELINKVIGVAGLNMEKIISRVGRAGILPAYRGRSLQGQDTEEMHMRESDPYNSLLSQPIIDKRIDMVAIGASTGGPTAIERIISDLPKDLPVPVAIAQHMPSGFTKMFADRLAKSSTIEVKEAEDGDLVREGLVLICPGDAHMTFQREREKERNEDIKRVVLKKRSPTDKYLPSVDIMMESSAKIFGSKTLGIILTGMGNDGTQGMKAIKENNGQTIAESEETSIIFGMPGEAIKAGVVDKVVPLYSIVKEIIRRCKL
ncbi:MAG: chemotaxis response regulator protein-glutamate methylesterase [Nitrospinae bacterium]|nr:chemotaxis response regulator protein-glutamate methylesterase [Nitrospinota bacterium]